MALFPPVTTHSSLQGSCKVGASIELPALKLSRPIKSIHMFHKPVTSIRHGDRAGICVTQLNPKLVERGLAAAPGSVPTFSAAVAAVDKVRFYAGGVPSKQKYHVIVGHATVMAEATFFGLPDGQGVSQAGGWWHVAGCCVCARTKAGGLRVWSPVMGNACGGNHDCRRMCKRPPPPPPSCPPPPPKGGLAKQQPADPSRLWSQTVHPPHPKNPSPAPALTQPPVHQPCP